MRNRIVTLFGVVSSLLLLHCSHVQIDLSKKSTEKAYIDFSMTEEWHGDPYTTFHILYTKPDALFEKNKNIGIFSKFVARFIVEPGIHTFSIQPSFGALNQIYHGSVHKVNVTTIANHVTPVRCNVKMGDKPYYTPQGTSYPYTPLFEVGKPIAYYDIK
jgi:hypothetical protein